MRDLIRDRPPSTVTCRLDGDDTPRLLEDGFTGLHPETGLCVELRLPVWTAHRVTMADDVPGVSLAHESRPTQFYNLAACGAGSQVRRCVFGPQRRHALLLRAPGCTFEDNVVVEVGGSGVWLGNEVGQFNEGPLPFDTTIRRNIFHQTQNRPVFSRVACHGRPADRLIANLVIADNVVIAPRHNAFEIHDAERVVIRSNLVCFDPEAPASQRALVLENVDQVEVDGLGVQDRRFPAPEPVLIEGSQDGSRITRRHVGLLPPPR